MARYVNHGGQCCGAGHIYGFTGTDQENVTSLLECISRVPRHRLTEIVLNDTQCRSFPLLLQKMADLGFVYVARWVNGNHGSSVNAFHRCDRRYRLGSARNWIYPGQILEPSMRGDLPPIPNEMQQLVDYQARLLQWERWQPPNNPPRGLREIRHGDLVEVARGRSRRRGGQFRVGGWVGGRYIYEWDHVPLRDADGIPFQISVQNLRVIEQAPVPPPPERPPRPEPPEIPEFAPHRHQIG